MPKYTVAEEIELLADADLLTERQAEAFVRRRVEAEPGYGVAQAMDVSDQAVSDYVREAEKKIERAEATLDAIEEIRYQLDDEE